MLVEGQYLSGGVTPTSGATEALQIDANGALLVRETSGGQSAAVTTAGADGVSNTQNDLAVEGRNYLYNGSTWDRMRSQSFSVPLTSTSISGAPNTVPLGLYKATDPTLTTGQVANLDLDFNGYLKVVPAYTPKYINTLTTTLVKTGAGILHSISVTSMAVGGRIGLYDATAVNATPIMSISIAGVPATSFVPYTLILDAAFTTGLTVLTSNRSQNMTISYR